MICGSAEYVRCYCKRHYEERQQKLRVRSNKGVAKMCSYCGETGHNIRSCPLKKSKKKRQLSIETIKKLIKGAK
jgi:hypothetical protein